MALLPELLRASWLIQQFEKGGFDNNVEVKPCVTYTMATKLDEMTDNMMLARQMFFSKFIDEEIEMGKPVLKKELQKLRRFEKFKGGMRIGMKAWMGAGRNWEMETRFRFRSIKTLCRNKMDAFLLQCRWI
jgi:hypothetical protein